MSKIILSDMNYLEYKIHDPIDINVALRNPELREKLRELTLCPGSGMNCALDLYEVETHKRNVNAMAIMASSCQKYIGWNLLTYESDGFNFRPKKENNACSHTFVMSEFRKCGVGGALIAKAVEIALPNIVRVYDAGFEKSWFFPIKAKHPTVKSVYEFHY